MDFANLFILNFGCWGLLQVLSMSRLGGAAAVAPLVADMASEVIYMNASLFRLFNN